MLPECPPEAFSLYLLYPHRHLLPAKVKVFSDFIVERTKLRMNRDPASSEIRAA